MLNLNELSTELNFFIRSIQENIVIFFEIIGAIWLINILNWLTGSKLSYLGVIPRRLFGLIGIFTGSFIHKNFNHLFFNTIPLIALGLFILSFGLKMFLFISCSIILIESILVWIFARPGIHIGASSLISGYFSLLLIYTYYNPGATSIFIAAITLYYFGSIFFGIFPKEEKTSWEGHLSGFIAGIIVYFLSFGS